MVRGIDIASSRVSAAPLPVRATAATHLLSGPGTRPNVAMESAQFAPSGGSGQVPEVFRYNSFEFKYRQDVGRIVLVGQSPETGERVVQVPSEQALRVYAQRARAEKLQSNAQLLRLEVSPGDADGRQLAALPAEGTEANLEPASSPTASIQHTQSVDISI